MATRLYLPSSGTSPLNSLAVAADWECLSASFFRAPLVTTKSNTALTDFASTFPTASTQQMCYGQWVSAPLSSAVEFSASEAFQLVVLCSEDGAGFDGHLAHVVRIVSGDGGTVRGELSSRLSTSTEFVTSPDTRIFNAVHAALSASAGDRIVVEVGVHGFTPSTSYTGTLRFGDPSATDDFALTAALTTDLCPWSGVTEDVTFSSGTAARPFVPDLQGGLDCNLTGGI